jgi:fucose 4-O-acetylase-like acetyltransferase
VDNARFLLVVLVVVGHNWAPVADAMRGVKAASLLVYAFHFPALVLLCGYLSRNFTGRPDQIRRLLTHVLVPYFVFEAAYAGVHTLMWEQPFTVSPTRPASVCWFLAALFVWRLTAPMWRAVRWPVVFAAALSVAAGLTDLGDELALPQMLMYWPWFVLGLRLRPAHLRPLRHSTARRWALPVMAAAAVGAWWVAPRVGREWLLMQVDNTELGMRPLQYVAVRLALFGIGAVLVAAFLALVPAHRTGYTVLGACALYPFLLHGLAVKAVEKAGGYDAVLTGGLLAVVGTTVLAIGLAALLGLPHVRQVLWPLVEPPFPGWLRGRGATGVRTGGGTPRHAVASDEVTTAPKTAASGVTSPSPTAGRADTDGTPPAVGRTAAGPLQTRPTTLGRPGADGPPAADDRPGPDDRPDDRLGFQPRGGRPGRAANVG